MAANVADATRHIVGHVAAAVEDNLENIRGTKWTTLEANATQGVGTALHAAHDKWHALQKVSWTQAEDHLAHLDVTKVGKGAWGRLKAQVEAYGERVEQPHAGDMSFSKSCGLKVFTIATGTTAASFVAFPMFLEMLGFGGGGVAAKSMAASWQSAIGNVEEGSLFALLQSISMGGLAGSAFVLSSTAVGFSGALAAVGEVCTKDEYRIVSMNDSSDNDK